VKQKFRERDETLPSVSLSRDDLEHIVALFRRTCEQIVISDKTHEYDTLDEVLQTAGQHPRELTILGTRPHVDLRLLWGGSKILYAEVGDNKSGPERPGEDLFFRICDFLNTRKHFMARAPGIVLILGLIVLGGVAIFESRQFPRDSYLAIGLFLAGIFIVIGGAMAASYVKGAAHLSLATKGSELSFWQRNKDKILMVALGGIISEAIHLISALIKK